MQTFLPVPDFTRSAEILDFRRLGKQRVEAKQLLNALEGRSKGWVNHPAARMWRGYLEALRLYHDIMILEWVKRGYVNNMPLFHTRPLPQAAHLLCPPWLGDDAFHASHRSNLLRKDPVYYARYGWHEADNLPYVWPVV